MNLRTLFLLISMTTLLGSCAHDHIDHTYTGYTNICGDHPAITGTAYVHDGDTITVDGRKIRLEFIDAPELKQQCKSKDKYEVYDCGVDAKTALQIMLQKQPVTCCNHKIDIYKRVLAECFVGDINVNKQMVAMGQAILYRDAKAYKAEQAQARHDKVGIWASEFEQPWLYRKNKKLNKKR